MNFDVRPFYPLNFPGALLLLPVPAPHFYARPASCCTEHDFTCGGFGWCCKRCPKRHGTESMLTEEEMRAESRLERPQPRENRQEAKHRRRHPVSVTFENCWRCQRERAVCASKITYQNRDAAFFALDAIHWREQYANPLIDYCCRVCGWWHIARVNGGREAKRSRRLWRRSLQARGLDYSHAYADDPRQRPAPEVRP